MTKLISGSGGGGGKGGRRGGSTTTAKDDLESKQYGRILDLLSEGEIGGLVDGGKSIFLDNTPLINSDGSENFKDVLWEAKEGTANQEVIPLTENTSTVVQTGFTTVLKNSPRVKQILPQNPSVDAVKVTISVPQLQLITDKGDIEGSEIELEIAVKYANESTYTTKVDSTNGGKIKGRTGDLYQRDYLLKLNGAFPVDIKVTRITDDSTNPKLVNAFQWKTYTEIIYDSRSYPNCALVGLKIDAEQFSSIPVRKYLIKGVKVKVPHNATVRADGSLSYSGTFNGTLGAAVVTNDPSWILYDLLTSNRYGLGADPSTGVGHLVASDIDKYSFYSASSYSSELINYTLTNSAGTTTTVQEPRFTCNVNIQTAQEAFTVINQLSSVFRAQSYWQAGSVALTQDSPQDTSYLFSIANVLEPGFTYQTASSKNRATVAVVKYFDNNLRDYNYEEVKSNANIAKYGAIVRNIDAFACTSRGQARRLGEWLLYTENNERETCSFVTSIDAGVVCRPGQIIEIADEVKAGYRRSGRIKSATTTAITVDDATGLTTSSSPTLSVILPDGSVESKNISSISSGVINVSSGFSSAPNANSLWVYQNSSIQTSTWRVVSVEEQDGINYAVTAVSYNSSKYNNIESGIALVERDVTDLNVAPDAPANPDGITDANGVTLPPIVAQERLYSNLGSARVKLIISWINRTDNAYVRYRYNNNNWESKLVEKSKQTEILDVLDGTYEIEVYSVSASGLRSVDPATLTVNTIGKTALPTQVTGIKLIAINEQQATLKWTRSSELDVLLGGQVLIRHSDLKGGATWGKASPLFTGENGISGNQTEATVPLLEGTYLLKFEDDGGRQSPSPGTNLDADWADVRVSVRMPNPTDRYLLQIVDESINNFPGTKTNTVYDSSLDVLKLSVSGSSTSASGQYLFGTVVDLQEVYDVNVTRALRVYSFGNEDLWDNEPGNIDNWTDNIDDVGALLADKCSAFIELRSTNDNPSSSPTWGPWQEFTNNLITARGIQFRLRLTSGDTSQNIAITKLGARIELQSRTESIQTPVSTGSQPYQVHFQAPFNKTPSVFVTQSALNQEEGDYFVVDNITTTGFEITFKKTGSIANYARSFVWGATGYGKQVPQ